MVGGPRARARVAGAHDPRQVLGRLLPVELELLDGELVGVGGLAGLRLRRRGGDARQRVDQEVGAERDEARPQLARGLVRSDRGALARVDRAGVEARPRAP